MQQASNTLHFRHRRYDENADDDLDRQERRRGSYIQKEEFEPLWFTGLMYILPVFFGIVSIICISVDISSWHSDRICEAKTNCQGNHNADECEKFDDTLEILFLMYGYSLASQLTKCGLVLAFFSAHTVQNMPLVATFDMRTVQRGVAGIVIWGTVLVLDCAAIVSCVYRYTMVAPKTADWEKVLYPKASDNYSLQGAAFLMITTMAAAFGSAIVCSVALARRITEVRDAGSVASTQTPSTEEESLIAHSSRSIFHVESKDWATQADNGAVEFKLNMKSN